MRNLQKTAISIIFSKAVHRVEYHQNYLALKLAPHSPNIFLPWDSQRGNRLLIYHLCDLPFLVKRDTICVELFIGCFSTNYYLIGHKFVGQKCWNFRLVSKILSDKTFCPSKTLSNISIQKSGKNWTTLSKFRLGVENFVRRNFVQ